MQATCGKTIERVARKSDVKEAGAAMFGFGEKINKAEQRRKGKTGEEEKREGGRKRERGREREKKKKMKKKEEEENK